MEVDHRAGARDRRGRYLRLGAQPVPALLLGTRVVNQVIAAATAVAFCVFASAATIGLSGKAREVLQPVIGTSHAAVVRYALVLIGAVTTLIVTLVLFGVPVGQLLLGGALTSVFVGIAAQQALSNVFAGLVLLLAHPFRVGDSIRLRAGALSGEIGGTVARSASPTCGWPPPTA